MQLKKGEKKTITLMINAVEEIEGTMAVEYAEGLAITFLEWEGTSKVKAEIECIDDFYKFSRDSFTMENYEYSEFSDKIPVAV